MKLLLEPVFSNNWKCCSCVKCLFKRMASSSTVRIYLIRFYSQWTDVRSPRAFTILCGFQVHFHRISCLSRMERNHGLGLKPALKNVEAHFSAWMWTQPVLLLSLILKVTFMSLLFYLAIVVFSRPVKETYLHSELFLLHNDRQYRNV